MAQVDEITLLHFNDVYHISDAAHVARFASVFADLRHVTGDASVPENQVRIFSGDAFSPSLEASVLRGEHMTSLLNELKIDVACYGNHDFDFGEKRLVELSQRTTFPWTLTNTTREQSNDAPSKRQLAGAHEYVIQEVAGYRIGFFGLAGTDWPSNCQHLPSCIIENPAETAKRTAYRLREQEKCDFVVALTHMRLAEDISVSQATKSCNGRIDLILGGHDHNIVQRASTDDETDPNIHQQGTPPANAAVTDHEGDVRIIKSGTDWNGFSIMRLHVKRHLDNTASIINIKLRQIADLKKIPNYDNIPPCLKTMAIISDVHAKIEKLVEKPLLITDTPLEGRSQIVRSQESNLGNMLADAVRAFYKTDIAFVNSGAIRCDRVINAEVAKPLRIRDVIDISPFDNAFVVKRINGSTLMEAFENSVSDAHTDGRFLQVSGVRLTADWSRPEGQRVNTLTYLPISEPPEDVCAEKMYTVAMVDFIALGFDGYSCFRGAETLVDVEGAMTDTNLLLQVFDAKSSQNDGGISDSRSSSTVGVLRARQSIVKGWHPTNGLPIIRPSTEGRITFMDRPNQ